MASTVRLAQLLYMLLDYTSYIYYKMAVLLIMMAVWSYMAAVFVTSFSQTSTMPSSKNCIQPTSPFSSTTTSTSLYLSSSDIQAKLQEQMAKLQDRDRSSKEISSDVSNLHVMCVFKNCDVCLLVSQ